ncbi:hypothetical protein SYK_32340 [Pseudodesulfovibrio nedwellii]|uniref:Uncharacterized protein n=1 Tax=Pseudodesulfovibrio nedwellii TaxID=2973072 RepID=A0ABM8B4U9_9BACT|nr:hypothetical protein [Pseudodesulfovibrio nedwellii]BDQ38874.1 hypothetical protein SYK_32340 [Pseudodesulfovibrio nedwellii]
MNINMLGTFVLKDGIPSEPDIVLANCRDSAMLGRLVSMFSNHSDIRFFLVENVDDMGLDLNADLHFLKDGGNWVLANNDTLVDVLFDRANFNPAGSEGTFLIVPEEGGYALITSDDEPGQMFSDDFLFVAHTVAGVDDDSDGFFIDPSVLENGEDKIVVSDFHFGSDVLELPLGMYIKDVLVDHEHDFTEVIIGQIDALHDDIVVKLLGVSQFDMPTSHMDMAGDQDAVNSMIQAIIDSPDKT